MTWDPVELDIARHADELGEEAERDAHIEAHWDEAVFQIADSEPAYLCEAIQKKLQLIEDGVLEDTALIIYLLKMIDPDYPQDGAARGLRHCVRKMLTDHPSFPDVAEYIDDMDRIACEP